MKTIVITGATSGIGWETAKLFLERGWEAVLVSRSKATGQKKLQELNDAGFSHAHFVAADVSSSSDVDNLFRYAERHFGGIDCIVNNAGCWHGGELHETLDKDWEELFDVNVKSIYLTAKYGIPLMKENGGGTIVNTASISGLYGDYAMAGYNAAKGAVVNLTKAMALDYGKDNIRVNSVCPSACATPMFLSNPESVVRSFQHTNPLGRICEPSEVAKAIFFLATEESGTCNGVNLPITGGLDCHTGQPIQ